MKKILENNWRNNNKTKFIFLLNIKKNKMNILEFIFFLQLNIIFSKSKLISVFTLNRHGTRAPITIDSDLKDYSTSSFKSNLYNI